MIELFSVSTYFFTALTVVAYALAAAFQRKTRMVVFNPIVIAGFAIIGFLTLLDIPSSVYQQGCQVLSYLLTPATICLAISFYEQIGRMKRHLLPILVGVLAGVVCSAGSIYMLGKLFAIPDWMLCSLLPKSVTAAIGVAISEEIGGIAAITTGAIAVTGTFGNIAGPGICRLLGIRHPIAMGVAFGTASHVIGTSKATELSRLAGAVGSLSLTIAGLFTVVLLSFLSQFI